MNKSISYHTRPVNNDSVKLVGGIFGGKIDQETVERIVKHHFNVIIKPSGSACFVDKEGREVKLYISVDPLNTIAGKEAKSEYNKKLLASQNLEDEKEKEIENILSSMSNDEILAKLRG